MDDRREIDDGVAVEDGVVRVVDVYHVEGYGLRPLCIPFVEGHVQLGFAEGLDFLSPKAYERVLGLVQVLFRQADLDEALPGDDICRAPIIDEDAAYIISSEVHGVFDDVGLDDKGIIMGKVLKPEVSFGK
jgi:hypothetical protein